MQCLHNACNDETTAACLRLHGYWEDKNSWGWMSVLWDWNHSAQSSNNKPSPLPFLPSAFFSPAELRRGILCLSLSSFLSSTSCLPAFVICHQRRAWACHFLRQRGSRAVCLSIALTDWLADCGGKGFSVTLLFFSLRLIKIDNDYAVKLSRTISPPCLNKSNLYFSLLNSVLSY